MRVGDVVASGKRDRTDIPGQINNLFSSRRRRAHRQPSGLMHSTTGHRKDPPDKHQTHHSNQWDAEKENVWAFHCGSMSLTTTLYQGLRTAQLKYDTLMDRFTTLEAQFAEATNHHARRPRSPSASSAEGSPPHKRVLRQPRDEEQSKAHEVGQEIALLVALWLQGGTRFGKLALRSDYDKAQRWDAKRFPDGLAQAQLRSITTLLPGFRDFLHSPDLWAAVSGRLLC